MKLIKFTLSQVLNSRLNYGLLLTPVAVTCASYRFRILSGTPRLHTIQISIRIEIHMKRMSGFRIKLIIFNFVDYVNSIESVLTWLLRTDNHCFHLTFEILLFLGLSVPQLHMVLLLFKNVENHASEIVFFFELEGKVGVIVRVNQELFIFRS